MTEQALAADEATMKFGLLMESAQAHQRLAADHLERLRAHTQELDGVVRDEIRRTLVEELQAVTLETQQAADALRRMRRNASVRGLTWAVVAACLGSVVPALVLYWVLPSSSEIARLRAQRERLATDVARLEHEGARARWRRCGEAERLCVQVDRKAPAYGEGGDYYVLEGY